MLISNNAKLKIRSKLKISVPPGPIDFIDLDTIAIHIRQNIESIKNPNFFNYNLDGDQYFISDGGNDMFDGGNYTYPWLLVGTDYTNGGGSQNINSVNYSQVNVGNLDTTFQYVSIGYGISPDRRPLTVLGTRTGVGNPVGFQKAGNIGADGGGNLVYGDVYTGEILNGFTVYAYYRQTYGQASDPAICDLYILLGHSNWGTVFGAISKYSNTNKNFQGAYFYTSGPTIQNVLAITTLLSRPTPNQIPLVDVQSVVTTYTSLVKTALNY